MEIVNVEYVGVIASPSGEKEASIEIEDNIKTVGDLLTKLGYSINHQKFILLKVNDRDAKLESPIKNGCKVTLFLPAGGG